MWLLLLAILPEHIRKRKSVKAVAVLIVISTLLFWWFNFPFQKVATKLNDIFGDDTKTILLFNIPDGIELQAIAEGGHQIFIDYRCPYSQCYVVVNQTERPLESYDAIVVFQDGPIRLDQVNVSEFETRRNSRQRLVYFAEGPWYTSPDVFNMTEFIHFFNWTMTYRLDSDIPLLAGRIEEKESAPWTREEVNRRRENARRFPRRPFMANKTKSAAWFLSNSSVNSQLEIYADKLSEYIDIDIYYDRCDNLSVGVRQFSDAQCADEAVIHFDYKFYLFFDNWSCPDYVTRLFFQALDHDVIPVVSNGARYAGHAPAYSYIDASHFQPEELGKYLKSLELNLTLYSEYFWWKDDYRVEAREARDTSHYGLCDLCQKLHQDFQYKSYENLKSYMDCAQRVDTYSIA